LKLLNEEKERLERELRKARNRDLNAPGDKCFCRQHREYEKLGESLLANIDFDHKTKPHKPTCPQHCHKPIKEATNLVTEAKNVLKDLESQLLAVKDSNKDETLIDEMDRNIIKLRNILNNVDELLRKHDLEHFEYATQSHVSRHHTSRDQTFSTDRDSGSRNYQPQVLGSNIEQLQHMITDPLLSNVNMDHCSSTFNRNNVIPLRDSRGLMEPRDSLSPPIRPERFSSLHSLKNKENSNNNDDHQTGPSTSGGRQTHEAETELFTPNPIVYYPQMMDDSKKPQQNRTKKE